MSGRRFALIAAFAMLVMFLASNLIANVVLRSWRLDLTQNQLYSLSSGTKQVLAELTEPVQLTLYYSRDAATVSPELVAYAGRVRELLHAYAARGHGKVRFTEVNVEPFTEAEDDAVEAGLQPLNQQGDPIYFGLAGANAIDDRLAIPAFDPARENLVEYEITRLIYELETPDLTRVAFLSTLPIDPANAGDVRFGPSQQSLFATEMGRMMNVETLAPDFTEIPAGTDVLVLIHPPPLSDAQAYAIDQFMLRTGRAFIAVDPASIMAMRAGGGGDPFAMMMNPGAPTGSNFEPFLSHWGVALADDVVMDLEGALPIEVPDPTGRIVQAPQPLFFRVGPEGDQLNREDLMTAWLQRGVNFGMAGALSVSPRENVGGMNLTATTLAETTGQTMRIDSARALARPSPMELLREWLPTTSRVEKIAVRLHGTLTTAFPNGPPEGAPPAADGAEPLTASAGAADIVVVSDADFLDDNFYVDARGQVSADNASFALNAIDVLSGSDAMVSLRSRANSRRPMKLVEDMEAEAARRIEQRREQLQTQLQETEAQLAELQAGGQGSGFFAGDLGAELTPEETAAMENFRTQVLNIRGELRDTERDLRANIDRLEAVVVFINMWLGPLLVAGVGVFLFWRRQRRTQTPASAAAGRASP